MEGNESIICNNIEDKSSENEKTEGEEENILVIIKKGIERAIQKL